MMTDPVQLLRVTRAQIIPFPNYNGCPILFKILYVYIYILYIYICIELPKIGQFF